MIEMKIWQGETDSEDRYVDFYGSFFAEENGKKKILNISCDSIFEVVINGEGDVFGACQNYPNEKQYLTFDITDKIRSGRNELKVTVWHQGRDFQTYIKQPAYLMFNISEEGKVLLRSGREIQSKISSRYVSGVKKVITGQLGFSFTYDFTAEESSFSESVELGEDEAVPSEVDNLVLREASPMSVTETEDSYIVDMGKEQVGFPEFEIESDGERKTVISYGEWLRDGRVPRIIGGRDFSFECILGKGTNILKTRFRRIAGRYLEIPKEGIKIIYLGIRNTEYPQKSIPKHFKDPLIQKIYDVSVYTLKCCMHEHYEDCPWREQCLYNMDSRNQMLCGYYAFEGHGFQRANLKLMTKGLLENGMLNICFPSGMTLPIPSFNLIYPLQIWEYIEHTGDWDIVRETGETVRNVMRTFEKAIDEEGLIPCFGYPCWNFYEWSDESHNSDEIFRESAKEGVKRYDLILNCLYVYAKMACEKIFREKYDQETFKKNIKRKFYVEKDGLFKLGSQSDSYSVLGNSLAILAGLGGREICEKLKEGKNMIPVTLSMSTFYYDALLKIDESYGEYVISDIKKKYSEMLAAGASTFWETEKGNSDFDQAGSLCHGWSAMPVYYFNRVKCDIMSEKS